MPPTIRIGFIGAGGMANAVHYPSLAEFPDVTLAAICDLDQAKLNKTADKYGVKARYTDYHQMLREVELDAVYVVMPPMPLRAIVLDVLAAGKHCFTEKPPGCSYAEAKEMADAAEKRGLLTMTAFNRRFAAVCVQARQMLEERGRLTQVMSEFHKDMLKSGPYYGLSIIRTDIIHVVDFLRWVGGEVKEVKSYMDQFHANWDNTFNALIRFQSGMVGILTANRATGTRYERFEIHGKGAAAYIRAPETAEVWFEGQKQPTLLEGEKLCGKKDNRITYGFRDENRYFIDCLKSGQRPHCCFQDSCKTMELCEIIERGGTNR